MVSGTNHIVKVLDTFCSSLLIPQQEPEKVGTIRIGLNKILMPLYIVCWLTAVLDIGSQYSLVTRETLLIGVRMFLKVLVATAWVILFIIYYRIMWKQRHLDHYWSTPANDRLITFLYVAVAFCVPEVLALVLFVVPWLRNFIENSSWRIFHVLTWWFQVYSSCFE
jgi:hypothetical protein